MIMKANKQIGFIYKNEESIDRILKDGDVVFERGFLRERTSTTSPITFGGVGKDLKDYKVYGNTVQSKLPSGYTQVDYIHTANNSYIDTGYKPNANTNIKMKINVSNGTARPFGVVEGNIGYLNSVGYWRIFSTSGQKKEPMGTYDYEIQENKVYRDGELIYTGETPISFNYNLYLFASNVDGTVNYGTNGYLYYFKIYDNNVLVRDFIPCYRNSDNEVGLYDLVNNVFYTNQGTGTFTYGSVAPTPDAPIEIISCGDRTKNLLNVSNEYSVTTWQEIDVNLQPGDYIVNCTDTSTNVESGKASLMNFYHSDNTYDQLYFNRVDKVGTVTITAETTKVRIYSGSSYTASNGKTTILTNLMIRKSNISDGTYEPYGYKIPVNVRSENLIPTSVNDWEQGAISTSAGLNINSTTRIRTIDYYEINNDTNYYISLEDTDHRFLNMFLYNSQKEYVGTYFTIDSKINGTRGLKINIPSSIISNVKYCRVTIRNLNNSATITSDEITTIKPMITLGNSKIPFVPYYNETTNIYLDEPLRKIDGYSDYIDFINGKVVRNVNEIVLNGTENWALTNNSFQSNECISLYTNKLASTLRTNQLYSNYFKCVLTQNNFRYNIGKIFTSSANQLYVNMDKSLISSVEDFKTWLSTHNTKVNYVLENQTEEDIELPNIPTIDENNTLNIETEITPSKVYIKYKSNT